MPELTKKDIEEMFGAFLPEDYDIPTQSNYMRLEQGENLFRILDNPVLGWEVWVDDSGNRKPLRTKMDQPFSVDVIDNPEEIKHFWAMPVWNYKDKKIQLLEITQKTILKAIKALSRNKDWGNPQKYDLSIIREGEKLNTKYQVIPNPPSKLSKEVQKEWDKVKGKLKVEALFDGEDPFADMKN